MSITRPVAFFITIIFFTSQSFAQTDSITVVKARWHSQKLAGGIKLKEYWFNQSLFNSNQNITILEIKPRRRNRLQVEADSQKLKITSEFGAENNAMAALNGTFFDIKNGGSVDYIRVNGKVVNATRIPANGKRAIHQKAAIVINDGEIGIARWDSASNWEDRLIGEDIMLTGPLLIYKKQPEILDTAAFFVLRHPRSVLAIRNNKILLITIDGRNDKAAGMSLPEVLKFLEWIGADDGINLDGGGSTTLWVKGKGVVNYPSDNKKWDHEGERPVANVIILKRSN